MRFELAPACPALLFDHLVEMSLKMRNRDAEASAITSGEGQVAKRENS